MKSSLAEVNENSLYLKFINFLAQSKSNFDCEYEVQTNTVDKIFKGINLKIIAKIDVEGFEINVIKGSQMKLKEISFILLENQFGNHFKNNNFKDIIKLLSEQNFRICKKFIFPRFIIRIYCLGRFNLFQKLIKIRFEIIGSFHYFAILII